MAHLTISERYYVQSSQVRGERRQYWVEHQLTKGRAYISCAIDCGINYKKAARECERLNKELSRKNRKKKKLTPTSDEKKD